MRLGIKRVAASLLDYVLFLNVFGLILGICVVILIRVVGLSSDTVTTYLNQNGMVRSFLVLMFVLSFWFYLRTSEARGRKATVAKIGLKLIVIGPIKGIRFRNMIKVAPVALWFASDLKMFGFVLMPAFSWVLKIAALGLLLFIVLELLIDDNGTFYNRKYGTRVMQAPDW